MKYLLSFAMAFALLYLTGCATIVEGKTQNVSFASNPDGATVFVGGVAMGKTPVTLPLTKQYSDQLIKFSKEGYSDVTITMGSALSPWIAGDIVLGGLLGSSTDFLSGAAFKYSPGSYMVTLPIKNSNPMDPASLTKQQKIINFVVQSYDILNKQLIAQQGDYLDSLFNLADIPHDRQAAYLPKLLELIKATPTIPEFAYKTANLLAPNP